MSDDFTQVLVTGDEILLHVVIDQKKQIVKSEVLEVVSSHKVIIGCPSYKGKLFIPSPGERYQMVIANPETGIFEFVGLIVGRETDNNLFKLHVLRVSGVRREQRREYYRISVIDNAILLLPDGEGEEVFVHNGQKVLQVVPLFKRVEVIVKDISAGGMRIFSKQPYEVGFRLSIFFEFERVKYELECEIVRCFLIEDVVKRYDLGIKFINMDNQAQRKLMGVIFEKQRKLLKKGLGS